MPYHPSALPSHIHCTGKHLLNSNRSVLYQDSDHTSHKPRFLNQILMAASTLPRNSNPHQHHHLHLHHSPFGVDTPAKEDATHAYVYRNPSPQVRRRGGGYGGLVLCRNTLQEKNTKRVAWRTSSGRISPFYLGSSHHK